MVRFFENGTKLKIPSEISPTLKGHCYMFTSYHLDFLKAEEQCNLVEGYLADILTKGPSICYVINFAEGGGKEGLEGSENGKFGLLSVLNMYYILFMLRGRPRTSRGSSIWQTYPTVIM